MAAKKKTTKTTKKKAAKTTAKKAAKTTAKKAAKKARASALLAAVIGAPLDQQLDITTHGRRVQLDTPSALALATKLVKRAPTAPRVLALHAGQVARDAQALDAEWSAVRKAGSGTARPHDMAVDAAWSAIHGRLVPWTQIAHERSARAAELIELVFPDGLRFLLMPWPAQWAEGQKRLRQVRSGGLEESMRELVGDAFWRALVAAQRAYGEALGLGEGDEAEDEEASESRVSALRGALLTSIMQYAVQVVAAHNAEPDAKARKALRAALAPIDAARAAAQRATSKTGETPAEDDGPATT